MNQTYQDGMDLDLQERPSNPMGLVGFILAFCLPPIGLVLSLIALAWRPRGFAIAGVIIGLITTTVVAVVGVVTVKSIQQVAKFTEIAQSAGKMQTALASAQGTSGAYPADLAAAGIAAENDPWGTPIQYEQTGGGAGYLLTTAGADKQFDTVDDILMDPYTQGEVMTIMGATSGAVSMFGGEAKNAGRVMLDLVRLSLTLDAQNTQNGAYPDSLEAIPGMVPKAMTDPWGSAYVYSVTKDGSRYNLASIGPDKKPGTPDDIDADQMNRGIRAGRQGGTPSNPPPTPETPATAPDADSETKPADSEEKK